MNMARLMPVRTQEDVELLKNLARADGNHGVYNPTHMMVKDDKVVGYFAIGSMPIVLAWFSTDEVKPRDAVAYIHQAQAVFATIFGANGPAKGFIPCQKTSPFYPYMEKLGYSNIGSYDLFLKEV